VTIMSEEDRKAPRVAVERERYDFTSKRPRQPPRPVRKIVETLEPWTFDPGRNKRY
jgi:hypothetical protein